jgi:hypothetical protein
MKKKCAVSLNSESEIRLFLQDIAESARLFETFQRYLVLTNGAG